MTRTDNVKQNLIFNIVKFSTQIVLQFVLRTALIYVMGAEYLGLNGLFTNIFSFLNLAELGIGSAIGFSMYKPIAEGDTEKIKSLQSMHKKFYLIIAGVVCALGLGLLPFLKFFINGEVTVDVNIYILYALYLVYTLVGYFSAHKRSLLFAYQRNDIENKIKTICLFGMTILQIALIFVFENYYIYFSVSIIFTIIECVLIHIVCNKLYQQINGKAQPLPKEDKTQIGKNVAALSFHKIGGAIIYSTDNILISSILGIVVLGAYSNYYMVITTMISVIALISNAITGSVGNMIACESKEYVYAKYKQINFIYAMFSIFCTVCMFVLFQPFIQAWTGGGVYMLDISTVILLCVSFFIVRMRTAVMIFKDAAGLFWQNRFVPAIEAILNIVLSIVLGIYWGINGIVLGTIISALLVPTIFEAKVLYKHYFKRSMKPYLIEFALHTVVMVVISVVCYWVCSFIPYGGIWWLIVRFGVCIALCAILMLIIYCRTQDFKNCIKWMKEIMNNFKNKKNSQTNNVAEDVKLSLIQENKDSVVVESALPKIAVIMSTYNGEKYIRTQLDSILKQKDVDLSLFVFDDVSKDSTVEIVREYESKYPNVKLTINERNKNYTYNFLDALFSFKDNDEYEYYAFSDQDDYWVEDKLITAINAIKAKGACTLYSSNLKVVDENLNYLGRNCKPDNYSFAKHDPLTACVTTGCTEVFDREFKNLVTKHYPQDLLYHDYWVGLIAHFCKDANYILDMDSSHILYRQHSSQASGGADKISLKARLNAIFKQKTNFKILKMLLHYFGEELNPEDKIIIEKFIDYRKWKNKRYVMKHAKRSHLAKFKFKLLFNSYVE